MSIITHQGIVTAVTDDSVTVSITPDPKECDGCAISKLCSKSEQLRVPVSHPSPSLLGRHLTIAIPSSGQRQAILLFFVVPIVVLILVLALCIAVLSIDEGLSCVIAIGAIVVWYLILLALRGRIRPGIKIIDDQ